MSDHPTRGEFDALKGEVHSLRDEVRGDVKAINARLDGFTDTMGALSRNIIDLTAAFRARSDETVRKVEEHEHVLWKDDDAVVPGYRRNRAELEAFKAAAKQGAKEGSDERIAKRQDWRMIVIAIIGVAGTIASGAIGRGCFDSVEATVQAPGPHGADVAEASEREAEQHVRERWPLALPLGGFPGGHVHPQAVGPQQQPAPIARHLGGEREHAAPLGLHLSQTVEQERPRDGARVDRQRPHALDRRMPRERPDRERVGEQRPPVAAFPIRRPGPLQVAALVARVGDAQPHARPLLRAPLVPPRRLTPGVDPRDGGEGQAFGLAPLRAPYGLARLLHR